MPMGGTIIQPFPASIPWTSVDRWCEVNSYTESEAQFLDHCIVSMDAAFINWFAEQQKQRK